MNQQEVYTLSEKTPLPKDVHLYTADKQYGTEPLIYDPVSNREWVDADNKEKWEKFLQEQELLDYPMIIVMKNNKYFVYFRMDYLFLPGC